MASGSERHQVVEALADAYVDACEGLPPVARSESHARYQLAAFSTAIDLVRRAHRDVSGDEILAAEDAVMSLYSKEFDIRNDEITRSTPCP